MSYHCDNCVVIAHSALQMLIRFTFAASYWQQHLYPQQFMGKDNGSDVSLSILVNDLAQDVWGWMQCAKLSLTGGISPKSPTAERKPAAPVGAVEAIFGKMKHSHFFYVMQSF